MATNTFRINTGAVKIEVNDEGEFITLPFGDQSFPSRFFALIEDFNSREAEFKGKAENIEKTDQAELEKAASNVALNLEIHQYFKTEIDKVFGAETCRKVFGDIVPSVELYAEFFDRLKPYFDKFNKERTQKMKKYSPKRTGNV